MRHWISRRWMMGLLGAGVCAFLTVLLGLLWLVPRVEAYRPALEKLLTDQTGYTIRIKALSGYWEGITPTVLAQQITLQDGAHRVTLPQIVGGLSIKTLLFGELRFERLNVQLPTLHIQRTTPTKWSINDWPLRQTRSSTFLPWLRRQDHIVLSAPAVHWQDTWRTLKPIALAPVTLTYTNHGAHQTLALVTPKAPAIGQKIAIKAQWTDQDTLTLAHWTGQIEGSTHNFNPRWLSHYHPFFQKIPPIQGKLDAKLTFQQGHLQQARVALKNGQIVQGKTSPAPSMHFTHLDGQLTWSRLTHGRTQGELVFNSHKSTLALPAIFKAPLTAKSLHANLTWQTQGPHRTLQIHQIRWRHAKGVADFQGQYAWPKPQIQLKGTLHNLSVADLKTYLPRQLNPQLNAWLNRALLKGVIQCAKVSLQGDPRGFPYPKGQQGAFHLNAWVQDAALRYDPAWPTIQKIAGQLLWDNTRLTIVAKSALTDQVPLTNIRITIPDIVKGRFLEAQGRGFTALNHYLRFVEKIPHLGSLTPFIRQLTATGSAPLDLTLHIPLVKHQGSATFEAKVALKDHTISFGALPIPIASHAKGDLVVNKKGLQVDNITFSALGGTGTLTAKAKTEHHQVIRLVGNARAHRAMQQYVHPLAPYVTGHLPYQVTITLVRRLQQITLQSPLKGARLALPHPFHKAAQAVWPLKVVIQPMPHQNWQIAYEILSKALKGQLTLTHQGVVQSHALRVGSGALETPQQPLSIQVATDTLALDPWIAVALNLATQPSRTPALPFEVALKAQTLTLRQKSFREATLKMARAINGPLMGTLTSATLNGDFQLYPDSALLELKVDRLNTTDMAALGVAQKASTIKLSDVYVESPALSHGTIPLGAVHLSATQDAQGWLIRLIRLLNPDGALTATLSRDTARQQTVSQFTLTLQDLGRYLANLGYGHVMSDGHGQLTGHLAWQNTTVLPPLEALSGHITLNLEKGYFTQIDPGAPRLFSLLSLQSLKQLAQFDFSRLFEQGFAFDYIYGEVDIDQGVLSSQELIVVGPTADLIIRGTIDFRQNTLALHVQLEPHVLENTGLATGVIALNPWVGVATLIGQQALKNPLKKIFEVHYDITGTLDKPIVTKSLSDHSHWIEETP